MRFCTSAGTRYSRITGRGSRSPHASRWTMKHHSASLASCTSRARFAVRLTMDAVVFQERGERRFERTAEPAERGRLLLRDLVIERDDATRTGRGRA